MSHSCLAFVMVGGTVPRTVGMQTMLAEFHVPCNHPLEWPYGEDRIQLIEVFLSYNGRHYLKNIT